MRYFKCVKGVTWFNFGNTRYKFAPNQVVKVDPSSEKELFDILDRHVSFAKHEVDEDIKGMVPRVTQLLTVPNPIQYMSREEILDELKTYNIKIDPYEMDDVLAQQLNTLRTITHKTYVTIIDKKGKPTYVQNLKEYVKQYREFVRIKGDGKVSHLKGFTQEKIEEAMKPKTKDDIDTGEQYRQKVKDGATTAKFEKEKDVIEGEDFNKVIADNTKDENIDMKDVKQVLTSKQLIDSVKIPDNKKYPSEDITPDKFRYLVDIDPERNFFKGTISEEDKIAFRKVNWNMLPTPLIECYMMHRGVCIREFKSKIDMVRYRTELLKALKELILEDIKERGDLGFIELNMLMKRYKEIDSKEPQNLSKTKEITLKNKISELKHYTNNFTTAKGEDGKKLSVVKLKSVVGKYFVLAKLGLRIPDTIDEIEMTLFKKGFIKEILDAKQKKDTYYTTPDFIPSEKDINTNKEQIEESKDGKDTE